MPVLVTFLLRHALVGFGISALFVAALTALDVCGLGTLLATSGDGILAVAILTFALGLTFGSVQMGFAVMLLSDRDQPPRGKPARLTRLVPSPLRLTVRR